MKVSRKSLLRKYAYCYRHCRNCKVPAWVHVNVGGTPCTDFSTAGSRKGWDGTTLGPTLAWARVSDFAGVCAHENVVGFPQLVEDRMSGRQVQAIPASPANLGYGQVQSRPRVYRCVGPAGQPRFDLDPAALYTHLCAEASSRMKPLQLREIFQATDAEIQAALEASCSLRAKSRRGKKRKAADVTSTFKDSLSPSGRMNLRRYKAKIKAEGRKGVVVSHLGDNPERFVCWNSKASGALPTLRRSMRELWVHHLRRPAMGSELMCSMGWPPGCDLHVPLEMPLAEARRFLGNGMHLANIFAVLLCLLACTPTSTVQQGQAPAVHHRGDEGKLPSERERQLMAAFRRRLELAGA